MQTTYDALILGGGPAGSTAAALLAREGRRILLADKEKHPRYHIGESLLPGVLPFLEELGVRSVMEELAFQRKTGQTFVWGRDRTPWRLDFTELDVYPYAYFVERDRFDDALLRNAARLGAELAEGSHASEVIEEDGRVVGARLVRDGKVSEVRARYVIDATGQNATLARRFRLRRFIRGLRNLAVWSYWQSAGRLPPPQHEHIITVSIADGWVWFIPLTGGRTSVGVVTHDWTRSKGEGKPDLDRWYEERVRGAELVGELLAGARRSEEVRAQRDWSYDCKRFYGPGWLLAGDAACFIDPILSTGVNLAMTGGYLSALALNSALADPEHEAEYLLYFQRAYRALFEEQLASIKHFYKVEARRDSVYWKSKEILKVDPQLEPGLAFLFINSGLARHVTASAPHDIPGQARTALASRGGAGPNAVPYQPRAAERRLLRGGDFVVVEGEDRRFYGVKQRGFRLFLEPHTPRGVRDRPPGSYVLLEIESTSDGEPVGAILLDKMRPGMASLPSARGVTVSSRAYARDERSERLLEDARRWLLEWIDRHACPDLDMTTLGKELRRALRSHAGAAWTLAQRPPAERSRVPEPPVSAEFERVTDGVPLWLVAYPRRSPEVADTPFTRTRFVDVEYRSSFDAYADRDARALIDSVVGRIRSAVAAARDLAAALLVCQDAMSQPPGTDGPWRLVAVRRVDPQGS